jgi:hypothetical protein
VPLDPAYKSGLAGHVPVKVPMKELLFSKDEWGIKKFNCGMGIVEYRMQDVDPEVNNESD